MSESSPTGKWDDEAGRDFGYFPPNETRRREVTPDELAKALQAVKESPGRKADWPYIDEFVIDGDLEPLVQWLCKRYRITPR